ncbi:hypothetical protein BCR35DRAFT_182270 [Leucosporidium creatinivorum]|uniref:Uncharacterized protein n=1 Tax=Leucosporidium creatinivorum TaxID=106004 RepID=A0A1Y2E634_9BASI|nr:hypothetical protein BCR35DRAFT_182270 [Leucosporidium creatinivorum]
MLDFTSLAWAEQRFPSSLLVALLESISVHATLMIKSLDQRVGNTPRPHSSPTLRFRSSPHPLRSLELQYLPFHASVSFLPFFKRLHQLISLTLEHTDPKILEVLPSRLCHLTILKPPKAEFNLEILVLQAQYHSRSNLKKWVFASDGRQPDIAASFVKECKRRGIKVE